MHVIKTGFHGNPNVGLYVFCTDKYALVGSEVPHHLYHDIESVLKLKVHRISIAGTPLIGVFLAGNKNCVLVPGIAFESELHALDQLKIPYKVMDTRLTCLGNNILCNDKFALVSPDFTPAEAAFIRKCLKVDVEHGYLAGISTPGSIAVMNSKGCLLHHMASEHELSYIQKRFQVPTEEGSVNMGSPYVKSGIIANDHGFVVGDQSGGPELVHIESVLGFN